MRTSDVAVATGYSAQQIRDLERLGVVRPAGRAGNGYREFDDVHVRELECYRDLAIAVGPVEARAVMARVHELAIDDAAALVSRLHVRLEMERAQALAARAALTAIRAEAGGEAPPVAADTMTITELSQALGVRSSALRFWEQAGLIAPERSQTSRGTARRYPLAAIREARITAALRAGGYRIPEVHAAITALRELGDVADSLVALDRRLGDIGTRTIALLRAGSVLAQIIESH